MFRLSLTNPWIEFLQYINQYEGILESTKQFYIFIQGALCINWEFVVSFTTTLFWFCSTTQHELFFLPEKTTPNWNVDSFYENKIGLFDKRQNDKLKRCPRSVGLTQRYGKYVTCLPSRMDSRFTGVSWQFRALGWCALHFNMFWQKKCNRCPWLSIRKGN